MPPLPPIPETFKSSITPKLIGKFFERVRADSEKSSVASSSTISKKSDNSTLRKLSLGKKKASLKAQISNPQLNPQGSLSLSTDFGKKGEESKRSSDDYSIHSPVAVDWAFQYQNQAPSSSKHEFGIAQPRLSPMEYARMYLLEKAQSEKENRPVELPAPEKKWFWTPGWEKFLIIPKVPSVIRRADPTETKVDVEENEKSHLTSVTSTEECPRLSLNLGGMNTLMPSTMDLGSLGALGNRNSSLLHSEQASQSNPELRRHSYNSGETRISLRFQPDARPLQPLSENSGQTTIRISNPSLSPEADTLSENRRVRKQESLPILLPRTYEKPIREFQNRATPRSQSPEKPRPLSSGLREPYTPSGTLLPTSRFLCTRRNQPLEQDGLTPGRIQSMAASILGEVNPRSSSLEPPAVSSPGILFGSHQSPQELIERRLRTDSLNYTHSTSPRRHSFGPVTPASPRSQTLESDPSIPYTMGSFTSPTLYRERFENDPFTDTNANSATLPKGERTSRLPLPDSPTLGRANEEHLGVSAESRDQVDAEESFQLLKSYMKSRKTTFANQSDNDHSPGQTSGRQGRQLTIKKSKPVNQGKHWYNSSFALNKAKSHEAFTLLPRVSPTSHQNNSSRLPCSVEMPPLGRLPSNHHRTRAIPDTSTALQNFDTTSRLASVMARHDSIALATPPAIQSQDPLKGPLGKTTKPSKLGSLFSRNIRRRSCGSSPANDIDCPDSRVLKKDESRDKVLSDADMYRNCVDSQEHDNTGSLTTLGATQLQQEAGRAVSGSSYSSTSSSGFAGLRDKLKFKKALSQGKGRPGLQSIVSATIVSPSDIDDRLGETTAPAGGLPSAPP